MSFFLFWLGALGIAGALETGNGMYTSLIAFVIGAIGVLRIIIKEEAKHKKHNFNNCNHNHSNSTDNESICRSA